MKRKIKRTIKRKIKRKRNRKRKNDCFCKRFLFLLLAPGSALKKFAATVNLGNTPMKVNCPLMAQCLGNLWKSCSLIRV